MEPGIFGVEVETSIFCALSRSAWSIKTRASIASKIGTALIPTHGSCRPWVLTTKGKPLTSIDFFGPERCMFESNFPVDKYSVSYHVLWNAFKNLVKDFSKSEKDHMFYKTASKVYSIP